MDRKLKLGLIGRGDFGQAYARTLNRMGIAFWHAGRDWMGYDWWKADGLICASEAYSHFGIASFAIRRGVPIVIEKPLCLKPVEATNLLAMAEGQKDPIVFTGYTRCFSPAWRAFKASLAEPIETVSMIAGGPEKDGWLLDWGAHLVALCIDLGFDPLKAELHEPPSNERIALSVTVNGRHHFLDVFTDPTPLEVLITEFCDAIKKGEKHVKWLGLGAKVVYSLKKMEVPVA